MNIVQIQQLLFFSILCLLILPTSVVILTLFTILTLLNLYGV